MSLTAIICCPDPSVRRGRVVLATGFGNFAFSLQSAAVLIALPYVSPFLHGIASSEWTATTYLLSITASLLVCGRLGDRFGNRRMYLAGLILFTLGSLVSGTTGHPLVFLMSRSLQGLGAALSAANSPAIITRWLPEKHYGSGFGWQAALTYCGLCLGPVAAAVLITQYGWRSIFLADLPIGAAAIALGLGFIPADDLPRTARPRFQAFSGILWLACVIPMLTLFAQGKHVGWNSMPILFLLVTWLVAIVSFYLWEAHTKVPLLNFRMRRPVVVSLSLASEAILYFCIYAIGFFIPLLLIRGPAPRPGTAGLILTIQGISRLFGAAAAGNMADRYGPVPVAIIGSSLVLSGSMSYCIASAGMHFALLGAGGCLLGLGTGVFVPANSSRFFANVANDGHGVASGVFATVRNLGMMLGMSCAAGSTYFLGQRAMGVPGAVTIGLLAVTLIAFILVLSHLIVGVRDFLQRRSGLPMKSTLLV